MTEAILQKMNRLANGFASERVDLQLEEISGLLEASDKPSLKKAIGRMLAVAYSKGYADAVENLDVKKLIF